MWPINVPNNNKVFVCTHFIYILAISDVFFLRFKRPGCLRWIFFERGSFPYNLLKRYILIINY